MCRLGIVSRSLVAIAVLAAAAPARAQTPPTYVDLAYSPDHYRQKLDLYIPADSCGRLPVVMFFFGGGWVVGDKADVAPYVDTLLARGFAIASVNYRYSYQAIFPAQIHDCKGATRWLRAHASQYNLDTARFAVFGESAGAHLAALLGTSAGVASLEGTVGGNLTQSSAVQAAGDFAGPTDLIALLQITHNASISLLFGYSDPNEILLHLNNPNPPWPALVALMISADPATHASAGDPPFQIVNGLADVNVPPSQAQHLHLALLAAGVPSTLTLLRGVGHGLPESAYEPVFDYFRQTLGHVYPAGDFNCDDHVNVNDLLLVIANWGPCVAGQHCPDADHNAMVSVDDLLAVITHWTG